MMPILNTNMRSIGKRMPAHNARPPARITPKINRKTRVTGLISIFTRPNQSGAKNRFILHVNLFGCPSLAAKSTKSTKGLCKPLCFCDSWPAHGVGVFIEFQTDAVPILRECLKCSIFSASSAYLSVVCVKRQLKRRGRRDTQRTAERISKLRHHSSLPRIDATVKQRYHVAYL